MCVQLEHAVTLAPVPGTEVVVFVEIPAGSRNKYEWDDAIGGIVLDRRLFTSMSYPADYGYIEGALGEDGDPLDALVLVGDPTFPGCRIRARAVGVFHMIDEKGADDKIICVSTVTRPSATSPTSTTSSEFRDEIEHFFQVYKDLEEKKTETPRLRQPRRGRAGHRRGASSGPRRGYAARADLVALSRWNMVIAAPIAVAAWRRKSRPKTRSSTWTRSSAEWTSRAATSGSIVRIGKKPYATVPKASRSQWLSVKPAAPSATRRPRARRRRRILHGVPERAGRRRARPPHRSIHSSS